jgi:hypothetical protein
MLEVSGTLKVKMEEQKVSERFRKRDFVIQDNSSQYPQMITFQLAQDRCNLVDSANLGDEIRVFFNLKGREWKSPQGETKYFNTIEAWKIELVNAGSSSGSSSSGASDGVVSSPPPIMEKEKDDDLPF